MAKKKEVKVPLEEKLTIRIAKDPSGDDVLAYVFQGINAIFNDVVTNDFIAATIDMWVGGVQTVEGNGKIYTISVQEIKPKESKIIKP